MRRRLSLVICVCLGVPLATRATFADYASTVENTPGLLAYFPLNSATAGTSLSSDGNNSATLLGNASISPTAAAPIVGNPAGLSLPNSPDSGSYATTSLTGGVTTAGTVMGWVNLNSEPSAGGRIYYIAGESRVGDDFDLQLNSNNSLNLYFAGGQSVSFGSPSSPALTTGTWAFIAATFNATTQTESLYINGQNVATTNQGAGTDPRGAFQIGNTTTFNGRDLDGNIDEVAVFNTDLSGGQIESIYNSATGAAPEPASGLLLGVAAAGLLARRRRK